MSMHLYVVFCTQSIIFNKMEKRYRPFYFVTRNTKMKEKKKYGLIVRPGQQTSVGLQH